MANKWVNVCGEYDLYIDWHYTKTSGEISLNRHNMLVEDLLKNSIEPKHWDAICKNVDK